MTINETTLEENVDVENVDEETMDVATMDESIFNNTTTISVRELKAHASKLLKLLEEDSRSEIIITRHGKPCGKLVGLEQPSSTEPPDERISLRNTMSHLANTGDQDLVEASNIWETGSNAGSND